MNALAPKMEHGDGVDLCLHYVPRRQVGKHPRSPDVSKWHVEGCIGGDATITSTAR